jgi:uncharacterized membrane protein
MPVNPMRHHVAIALHDCGAQGWSEQFDALAERLRALRRSLGDSEVIGLSLRIPALAAFELYDRDNLSALKSLLDEHGFYVFSLDGTDFGERGMPRDERWGPHFPDWRDMRRMAYCNVLADILAELLPDDVDHGSITTLAIGSRDAILTEELPAVARNVLRIGAYLHMLEQSSGKRIMVGLQPMPGCVIETAADAARFFREYLFSPIASAHFSSAANLTAADADEHLRHHVGVSLNSCFMACQHESISDGVRALRQVGVPIAKVVLANGLVTRDIAMLRRLPTDGAMAEAPVVHRVGGEQLAYPDVKSAAQIPEVDTRARQEWRIACHAPVSQAAIAPFATTQPDTLELLKAAAAAGVAEHVEINVDSLTEQRTLPPGRLVRERQWVIDALGQVATVGSPDDEEGLRSRRRRPPKFELAGLFR